MKKADWKERLGVVYSTNPNFQYETEKTETTETLPPDRQPLRISMERKGRGGKTATLIKGFIGTDADLNELTRLLKNRCGVGGAAKAGIIIIQGDLRDKILSTLQNLGYTDTK